MKKALLMALVIVAAGVGATDYYKWQDENGTWHYSLKKPKDKEGVSVVNVSETKPRGHEEARENLNKLEQSYTGEQQEGTAPPAGSNGPEAAAIAEKNKETLRKNCEIHKRNLQMLKSSPRIKVEGADGQSSYITEDQRQAKIKEAETALKDCESADNGQTGAP